MKASWAVKPACLHEAAIITNEHLRRPKNDK